MTAFVLAQHRPGPFPDDCGPGRQSMTVPGRFPSYSRTRMISVLFVVWPKTVPGWHVPSLDGRGSRTASADRPRTVFLSHIVTSRTWMIGVLFLVWPKTVPRWHVPSLDGRGSRTASADRPRTVYEPFELLTVPRTVFPRARTVI